MRDIVAQTPRPAHVRNSVSEFLHKFSSAKYVAMHWRYNDDDWAMHCEHDHGNQKTCNKIIEIMHDATKMGSAFVAYLRKLPNIRDERTLPDFMETLWTFPKARKLKVRPPAREVDEKLI